MNLAALAPAPTLGGRVAAMGATMWFVDRMVRRHADMTGDRPA